MLIVQMAVDQGECKVCVKQSGEKQLLQETGENVYLSL